MPREKVYANEAEKKAAYRARKAERTPDTFDRVDRADHEGRRDVAIALGRALGEHEARSRGEVGLAREQRIARASAYAAWDHDGRPFGRSAEYHKEFSIRLPDVTPSADRLSYVRLISDK